MRQLSPLDAAFVYEELPPHYPGGIQADVAEQLGHDDETRHVCRMARDILGGNEILLDFHVMRHMCDMEALLTYEGTAEIQTLPSAATSPGRAPSRDPIRFRRSCRPGQRAERLQGDE